MLFIYAMYGYLILSTIYMSYVSFLFLLYKWRNWNKKTLSKGGKKAYFGIEEHVIFLPDQDTFERESTLVIEKKMLVLKAYFVCSKTPRWMVTFQ